MFTRKTLKKITYETVLYLILVSGGIMFLLPLLWMFSTSLKPMTEVYTFPPEWIPSSFNWSNYWKGWTMLPFNTFLANTCLVTGLIVLGNLVSCSLAAFGFARLRCRTRDFLFIVCLSTMMLPYAVTIVPLFALYDKLDWINTFFPLWVPAWFGYPFFIFLLRQFFMGIPRELDDAAKIDGCGYFGIYTRVILPLSKPALTAMAILAFVANWNDFLRPLIFLNDQEKYTLALGLTLFKGTFYTLALNKMMAVTLLVVIPVIAVFFFAQRYFIKGITLSGLKG